MILHGPVLRQSSEPEPDTKSDQEVKEGHTVIDSGSSFAPSIVSTDFLEVKCMDKEVDDAGSTEKANQKPVTEEVKNKKCKKPTSIVPCIQFYL